MITRGCGAGAIAVVVTRRSDCPCSDRNATACVRGFAVNHEFERLFVGRSGVSVPDASAVSAICGPWAPAQHTNRVALTQVSGAQSARTCSESPGPGAPILPALK